jgi:ATP-dependent DNA helicase HFM1/MER3
MIPYPFQTLAVGVNLREFHPARRKSCLPTPPLAAHIVVIKDVRIFQNGVSQEYSDLDITQMIGRAVSETRVISRA